jgi:hypothetical protein
MISDKDVPMNGWSDVRYFIIKFTIYMCWSIVIGYIPMVVLCPNATFLVGVGLFIVTNLLVTMADVWYQKSKINGGWHEPKR